MHCSIFYIFLSNSEAQNSASNGFVRGDRKYTFCNTPRLTTSRVSYWGSKRPGGLGKSGSNRVITEPMLSKTGLSKALNLLTYVRRSRLQKKAVATKCISTALK